MTFLYKYGEPFQWRPIRDVLQRWRLSLASLLVFTILLADNLGLSLGLTSRTNRTMKYVALAASLGNINNFSVPMWETRRLLSTSPDRQQCLVLHNKYTQDVCCGKHGSYLKQLNKFKRSTRLTFCSDYLVYNVLDSSCFELFEGKKKTTKGNEKKCRECIENLLKLDQEAKVQYSNFLEIFNRYDCVSSPFSVKWNCTSCQVGIFLQYYITV